MSFNVDGDSKRFGNFLFDCAHKNVYIVDKFCYNTYSKEIRCNFNYIINKFTEFTQYHIEVAKGNFVITRTNCLKDPQLIAQDAKKQCLELCNNMSALLDKRDDNLSKIGRVPRVLMLFFKIARYVNKDNYFDGTDRKIRNYIKAIQKIVGQIVPPCPQPRPECRWLYSDRLAHILGQFLAKEEA